MSEPLYPPRDPLALDRAGGYYARHVRGMTAEKLHGKAEIAEQLAWRDAEIDRLRAALDHIGGLSRALRSGGPDPSDLQELSDALHEAVDTAHAALAGTEG